MKKNSLLKNTIYNTLYKSLNVIFPLLTTMYVSRILLSDGVGKIASAQNLAAYFTLIAALGLPTYGTKRIAECRDDNFVTSKTFTELYIISCISTMICIIGFYSIICTVDLYNKEVLLYGIIGLQIILNLFNIDWFYYGLEQYKYIMIRSLIVKVLGIICILFFVQSKEDYLIYALISTLSVALNYILNIFHLRGKVKICLKGISLRQHIKPVLILLASSIAVEIYTLSDVTMLKAMTNDVIVGYYSTSIKGIKIIKNFITAICSAFLPRLSYYYSQNRTEDFKLLARKGIKLLLYLSVPAAAGCILLADLLIVLLFGKEFEESIMTTMILAPSIVTIAMSNFIGYQVLVSTGYEKNMMFVTIFGAILNITMNLILIPIFQHNGAAVASVITEALVAFIQYLYMSHIMNIRVEYKYIISIGLSTLVMIVTVLIFKYIITNALLSLILSVTFGSFVYFVVTLIIRNEIAYFLLNKSKNILLRYVKYFKGEI